MSLNGFIVLNEGGSTIYSKIVDDQFDFDPILIGPLLEAIQIFARNLDNTKNLGIEEMVILGNKLKYRHFENFNFIGIIDPKTQSKAVDLVFEYIIWAFLSKFRSIFEESERIFETTHFKEFDDIFLRYRIAKEKKLKKWLEKQPCSKLQGMLNKMTNLFPISEIIKINHHRLKIIGKRLIWVDINIKSEEVSEIFKKLERKTTSIYGPGLFKTIENEVEEKLAIITHSY
ncbi:MAG: hypothetical protein ACFFDK_08765 [Promethearchaeota archaeon]